MKALRMVAASALAGVIVFGSDVTYAQDYVGDVGIEEDDVTLGKKEYSPYLNRAYPDRVLWGDTLRPTRCGAA